MKKILQLQIILILFAGVFPAMSQTVTKDKGINSPIEAWWTIFNDPLLDSLEEVGLQQNWTLQEMIARVDEARERIRSSQSYQYPILQLNPYFASQSLSPNRPTSTANQEARQLERFSL